MTENGESPAPPVHHVSRATYPIPQPLTRLLRAVIEDHEEAQVESIESALAEIVGNSFQAMDSMYFGTPASTRNKQSFAHRLCVRVMADPKDKTLTITDLGSGMTRGTLINGLGIGHLSRRAMKAAAASKKKRLDDNDNATTNVQQQQQQQQQPEEEDGGKDESDDEEEDGGMDEATSDDDDDDSLSSDDMEEETTTTSADDDDDSEAENNAIPCRVKDVGGFYAALFALAVGVNVGTKSNHDDYYEFELGLSGSDPTFEAETFSQFVIVRPMDEGEKPSAQNGYDRFGDVRGESGTRVTLRLNEKAVEAGLLQEDTLKPILTKIFETSQYTVAFSSDADAQDIIDASQKEIEDLATALAESAIDGETVECNNGNGAQQDDSHKELLRPAPGSHNSVKERAKYIPIRLSLDARKMLRLVEAAMTCCNYTDSVDKVFRTEARRTHAQLGGITSVLRGLVTACDYPKGQRLLEEDNYADYEIFFRQMFEIARRHKIMNPEKMRTEYGKLIYLIQDAVSPSVQPHLGFSCKGRIESVYKFLEERRGLAVLEDKLIEVATEEILAEKKTRARINQEIRRKERAVATIKSKYQNRHLSEEDIHLCLYSICDNNSFLNSNRVPVDKIIEYLKKYFAPSNIQEGYSLSIVSGQDGARLSHSHERQYYFALQSLTLWRDIIDDMFRLWHMAEEDLLSDFVTYSLQDTGQGMHRVQQSPQTYKAMQQILARVQSKVKDHWVGSSVIHLGDHNVPNALSFIDKYTQVPRILGPIVSCLENLERIYEEDDGIKEMVDSGFGGLEKLRKDVLHDFFRSAFDGSGADNFYDAGSCIDGRLTSAWNWCSQLPNKPFYTIFKLTGFIGFDGDFK